MTTVVFRHLFPLLPGSDIQIQSGKLLRGRKCLTDHIGTGKTTVGVLIDIQLTIIRRTHLGSRCVIGQGKNILQIKLTISHFQEGIVDTVPIVMQLGGHIVLTQILNPFDLQLGQIQMVAKVPLSLFSCFLCRLCGSQRLLAVIRRLFCCSGY